MFRTGRIEGVHVFALIGGFVALFVAANVVFITLALKSFPGQEVERPYEEGVNYNATINERDEQNALGWNAYVETDRVDGGGVEIALRFEDAAGRPVHGLALAGDLRRPASDKEDRVILFTTAADGVSRGVLDGVGPGAWDLGVEATSATGDVFVLEKRLILQ